MVARLSSHKLAWNSIKIDQEGQQRLTAITREGFQEKT